MKKILIIDDEEAAVYGYKRYLTKRGFGVDSATNLEEGRRMLSRNEYDALLLDIRLPDGNALHALPSIREKYNSLLIAVVSGVQDPRSSDIALSAGADRYLVKPVRVGELCESVIEMLGNGLATREC